MKNIFLTLPLSPTINSYYQFHGHRRYVGEAGKKFKAAVAHAVSLQNIRFGAENVRLFVTIHFRDKRRQDLSNRIKALEDALVQAGLLDDDSQIKEIRVVEGEIVKGGKIFMQMLSF